MRKEKLLIFDMDGTLLDSMELWTNLGRFYLESKGKIVQDDLEKIIDSMTLEESASYFKFTYKLKEDVDTIIKQILDFIKDKYLYEIPLKKGAYNYLKSMKKKGNLMCILTTSEKSLAIAALKRNGVLNLFNEVYTDKDFDMSKRESQLYINVCKNMNVNSNEAVVYEDSLYAIESAKKAGCKVIGVYDDFSKKDWKRINFIADEVIINF